MNDQSVGGRAAVLAGYVDVGGKRRSGSCKDLCSTTSVLYVGIVLQKWRGNKANAELAADERFSKKKSR